MSGESSALRRVLVGIAAIVVIAFVVYAVLSRRESPREAIREVPPAERQGMYERELAAFRSTCVVGPGDALRAYCESRAKVLRLFPECDAGCQEATAPFLPQPTR